MLLARHVSVSQSFCGKIFHTKAMQPLVRRMETTHWRWWLQKHLLP